jgi:hypothetical protein
VLPVPDGAVENIDRSHIARLYFFEFGSVPPTSPWIFEKEGEGEGFGPNEDGIPVNFVIKPYVQRIKVDTGDGGDVLVYSRKGASSGSHARYTVLKEDSTSADDNLQRPIGKRVDGIYIETLPDNAKVVVWHGREDEE